MDLTRYLPHFTPALDWVQVEVTSHCTNPDAFAMRLANRRGVQWAPRHMDTRLFERLTPLISRAGMVHLRGWGDPFMHPLFPELLNRCRSICASVTTATCGENMTEEHFKVLIGLQIDSLTVPMAGMAEADNLHRRGTSLEAATTTVSRLRKLRDHYGSAVPGINILYTLTRTGLDNGELDRLPVWAGDMGADGVIVTAQSFGADDRDAEDMLVPANEVEYRDLLGRLNRVRERAAALGLSWFHFVVHGGADGTSCIERPARTAFIGSDGRVAPCVFSLLPVRDAPPPAANGEAGDRIITTPRYWFEGREYEYPLGTFGNVGHTAFRHIWASPAYRDFRMHFERGRLPGHCRSCWRPYMIPA